MPIELPIDVVRVLQALQEAGYQAYVVGGAVRDLLQEKQPTDWDFTTDATPEQILAVFPEAFYENTFGTVAISRDHIREQFNLPVIDTGTEKNSSYNYNDVINVDDATKLHESLTGKQENRKTDSPARNATPARSAASAADWHSVAGGQLKNVFEITTFRSDGIYTDFRRPNEVSWGKTIEEDLARRDFTINAMALQIKNEKLKIKNSKESNESDWQLTTDNYVLIDPYGGQQDLESKIIRTVGDPATRFQEDALRLLRAIRFCVQLEFDCDQNTSEAIYAHSHLISHVSWERIRDEFLKMMASNHPADAIEILDETRILQIILPELLEGKGVMQGGHHTTDVWTHALDALAHCPSSDPIVRFATLLHDIAKPHTYRNDNGHITFYNHELVGARMAKAIAQRFKLSRHDIDRMFTLVRHHMFYYQPENTDAAIRRFMRKVGLENINDILDLRIGDRLGSGSRETSWRLEEMKQRMQEQLHQPFSITDLAIDGTDLMTELNLQPGPIIGKILKDLFEQVAENPELNTKERLLALAKTSLS